MGSLLFLCQESSTKKEKQKTNRKLSFGEDTVVNINAENKGPKFVKGAKDSKAAKATAEPAMTDEESAKIIKEMAKAKQADESSNASTNPEEDDSSNSSSEDSETEEEAESDAEESEEASKSEEEENESEEEEEEASEAEDDDEGSEGSDEDSSEEEEKEKEKEKEKQKEKEKESQKKGVKEDSKKKEKEASKEKEEDEDDSESSADEEPEVTKKTVKESKNETKKDTKKDGKKESKKDKKDPKEKDEKKTKEKGKSEKEKKRKEDEPKVKDGKTKNDSKDEVKKEKKDKEKKDKEKKRSKEAEEEESSSKLAKAESTMAEKAASDDEKINSNTHHKEYLRYKRWIRNGKRFPTVLGSRLTTEDGRAKLFVDWGKCGGDVDAIICKHEQSLTESQASQVKWGFRSEKWVTEKHGEEKGKRIIERKKTQGLYIADPEEPEDSLYFCLIDIDLKNINELKKVTSLEAKGQVSDEMLKAFTTAGGVLDPQASLKGDLLGGKEGMSKAIAFMGSKATTGEAKGKGGKKRKAQTAEETPAEVKVETPVTKAKTLITKVLKDANTCRRGFSSKRVQKVIL